MASLFDVIPPAPFVEARAANADPVTSHEAAARMTQSGKAAANAAVVLACLRVHPGCTSRELSELIESPGIDRHETARRLPDLERAGAVRKGAARVCRAGGTKVVTWWPVG